MSPETCKAELKILINEKVFILLVIYIVVLIVQLNDFHVLSVRPQSVAQDMTNQLS